MATTAPETSPRPDARSRAADPRTGPAEVAAIALGVLLLVDVLRVWLPSLITIYGSAGSTPAEQIGAFALLWFVAPLVAVPLALWIGADRLAFAAALALAFTKFAAGATGGAASRNSTVQLYVLCAALAAGLAWLFAMAMSVRSGRRAAVGVTAGLAASVGLHSALGMVDLTWRDGPAAALAQAGLACAFVGCVAAASARNGVAGATTRLGAGGSVWVLVGPAILLTGVVTGATGLGEAAPGWSIGVAGMIVAAGALLAVPLAARPRLSRHPAVPALFLVAGVAAAIIPRFRLGGIAGLAPPWVVAGQVVGALALGAALGWIGVGADARAAMSSRPDRPWRRGLAAGLGTLLFVVLTFGYYAAYDMDLGFPNEAVPVAIAVLIGLAALRVGPRARRWGAPVGPPGRAGWLGMAALGGVAVVVAAQLVTAPDRPTGSGPADFPVRLVAYNIRMGFGLDGRFDPGALAATIRKQRPDIVLLSEVDRGWFLNGGHDGLQLIADRLGMRTVFAPAADQLWGDALLTRLPVLSVRSHPLPRVGAPTGAEALAAVVKVGDQELGIVGTHLQPPPGAGPAAQAKRVARIAADLAAGDRPVVVAGDLNIEPRDAEFRTLLDAGLRDGLAAARPLATFPSDMPDEEIDHVLTTPDLLVTDVVAPPGTGSDHRAVAVTLTYQNPEELRPAD